MENIRDLALALCTLGLTYLGFVYDSGWAFFGAILCLFELLD